MLKRGGLNRGTEGGQPGDRHLLRRAPKQTNRCSLQRKSKELEVSRWSDERGWITLLNEETQVWLNEEAGGLGTIALFSQLCQAYCSLRNKTNWLVFAVIFM